jgi:aspartyl-tRNA(Asn)/glutamyl-tRNA(Gln) amidotransferase subunit B
MPKNYQISQYDMPLTQGGVVRYWLADGTRRECRLTRIHLEEDTGKSTHAGSGDGRIAGSTSSLVDFNRAGVPLMECVSDPDIRTSEEAVAYLDALKRTFVQLGVSDVKMEEGSLRCDANVSVRLRGAVDYGTKTEIKNMNSFRSVQRAIESEETRGWDEAAGVTHPMRSKEKAHDYRYFPDPDLMPMEIDAATVERVQATLPELPIARYERYVEGYALNVAQATQLVENVALADYFDRAARASTNPAGVLNFVLGDLSRLANEHGIDVAQSNVTPEALAELVALSDAKTINSKVAKDVLVRLWRSGGSAAEVIAAEGLAQVSDPAAITGFVNDVLAANAKSVADFRAGKQNALKFLTGQVMKISRGTANPALVETVLRERLQ